MIQCFVEVMNGISPNAPDQKHQEFTVINENSTKRERINYMFDKVQEIYVATIKPISIDWLDSGCLHCDTMYSSGFSQWVHVQWRKEQTLKALDELSKTAGLNVQMKAAHEELLTASKTPFAIDDLPFTGFWKEVIRLSLDTLYLTCPHLLKEKPTQNCEHRTVSEFLQHYINRTPWEDGCSVFNQRILAAWIAEHA